MLGRMMDLQFARNPSRFTRIEYFVEHAQRMCVQLIHHDPYQIGIRKMDINQVFETMCDIQDRAARRHFDMTPAALWADEHKQVAGAFALVFIIMTFRMPRAGCDDGAQFADQLVWALVKAHARTLGIFRLGIQIQHILHMIDKFGTHGRDDPLLDLPRLKNVFLSVRRTVSSEMVSTTSNATSSSASSCIVQRACPSGAALQAVAIRRASCLASSARLPPGRGRSVSAPSRLPSTKRWRVRSTVVRWICSAVAIAWSVAPSSACKRM